MKRGVGRGGGGGGGWGWGRNRNLWLVEGVGRRIYIYIYIDGLWEEEWWAEYSVMVEVDNTMPFAASIKTFIFTLR